MLAKVISCAVIGLEGAIVEVEVDISPGLPQFTLEGQPVALVHQYRRKEGSLGVSGRPDPKRLFTSGKIIALRESP